MHIEIRELKRAIDATERKLGGNIDLLLAEGFLSWLVDKKNRMRFKEALLLALSELYIWDKNKGRLYALLGGNFFGERGRAVLRANFDWDSVFLLSCFYAERKTSET